MEANELNHEVGAPVEPTGAAIARRLLLEAMAREASATGCVDELTGDAIGRFAALVRAQALEEAAVIADDMDYGLGDLAAAIRAAKEQG